MASDFQVIDELHFMNRQKLVGRLGFNDDRFGDEQVDPVFTDVLAAKNDCTRNLPADRQAGPRGMVAGCGWLTHAVYMDASRLPRSVWVCWDR